jgi:Ca2+-transporting ATPase
MKPFWTLSDEQVALELHSHPQQGLSDRQYQEHLRQYGLNQLPEKKGRSPLSIFLSQFQEFIVWVLAAAAMVSGFLGEWIDAAAILAIIVLNAVLGFIQEYRAEKSMAALKKLASPFSRIIRGGRHQSVASADLVPGDLVELEAGDHIPADARLTWVTPNFCTQEASLTGESAPVAKTAALLEKEDCPLADRTNMVFLGTAVVSGKARAMICQTGRQTELGNIAGMLQTIEEDQTPLQRRLEEFGKWIVYICFVLVGVIFVLNLLRGGKIIDVFLISVSLAVAAIPEGLPAVVTVALAIGMQRMLKRHVLIRKLPAVETLGCATVICSDKTGTLTRNEMTVQAIFADNALFDVSGIGYRPQGEFKLNQMTITPESYPGLQKTLLCSLLCNGAQLVEKDRCFVILGDPTEGAMLTAAAKTNLWKEQQEKLYPFVEELPFDSDRKCMTVIRKAQGKVVAYVKGAPDILLSKCTRIEENGAVIEFGAGLKERILTVSGQLADRALRVLGVAFREVETVPSNYNIQSIEHQLTWVGLIGMIDPPREEVKAAVAECKQAGIKTVMITGDHKNTAAAVARELGFFTEKSLALTGEELDRMSQEQLEEEVEQVAVYARVSPEHKLRIVKAWRKRGDVTAMTGDGVNDAPAVKEADIGVAMGITGTDVTKEVADMVITDDNFTSIVAAVREGRGIYDNIQKFIHYLLSCNTGEILVMFIASILGWPVPLLPIQILWVNLVTDGLPALALGMEPMEATIMQRPPRKTHQSLITKSRGVLLLIQGVFIAACCLLAFYYVLFIEKGPLARAMTAAFLVLSCSQLFHSFNCRSMTQSVWRIGFFTNPQIIAAFLISLLLQLAAVSVPMLQKIFKTESLNWIEWLIVLMLSSFPLWAMEAVKWLHRKKPFLASLE